MEPILFENIGGVYQIYSSVHQVIGHVLTLALNWNTLHSALGIGNGLSCVQYHGEQTFTILDMIKINVSATYCSSLIFG
jgi:hypothetical protein